MREKIEIPFSKTKLGFGIVVFLCIILILALLLLNIDITERVRDSVILIVGIVFSGIGIVLMIKKMLNNAPAIVISEEGIIDNTKKQSLGMIEWKDISHVSIVRAGVLKVLLVHLHSTDKYLDGLDVYNTKNLRKDYEAFGTPIVIMSSIIKISLPKLETLLNSMLAKYKNVTYQ